MKITENFEYIGTQQNFGRDSYTTLAEMKAVVDKRMPDIFTATCKETGKFYIYNKNNEVDETLGKWRELSLDSDEYVTKTYVDTELANKSDIDHTHTTVNGHTVESDVPVDAKFTDTVYDDTDIKAEIAKKADITSIPSKISELANDSNYQTAEQISSTVTTEIAKVVADAPENFDTLKEMSDWIAGHENDASAMNSAISDNKTAIASLQSGKADKSEIPTTVSELTDSADYAKKTDLHSHTNKTVLDSITDTKVSNWDSAKTHADSAHAPSNAQANVLEIVKVNGTALEVSNKAVNVTVPTKVSELTNDSEYIIIDDTKSSDTTTYSSSKIVSEITNEATTRQNADTALQSALALRKSYDLVVDSNETLLEWANCTDGSMKSVLVKSGEYTLDGKEINLVNAGTKFVFAEDGNKINVTNYLRGIGATEDYGAVIVGLNVEVSYNGDEECFAFYRGMICYNCTGTCTGSRESYGFSNCTCSNCTGTGISIGYYTGYGFSNCTCSNCIGSSNGNSSGYGFYNCTCSNCTGTDTSYGNGYGFSNCTCSNCTGSSTSTGYSNCTGYGFYNCTCSNCTGTGTGSSKGYGFYNCSYCSSCRAGKKASTTATWGGTNTYIDSDSCDYVAS